MSATGHQDRDALSRARSSEVERAVETPGVGACLSGADDAHTRHRPQAALRGLRPCPPSDGDMADAAVNVRSIRPEGPRSRRSKRTRRKNGTARGLRAAAHPAGRAGCAVKPTPVICASASLMPRSRGSPEQRFKRCASVVRRPTPGCDEAAKARASSKEAPLGHELANEREAVRVDA